MYCKNSKHLHQRENWNMGGGGGGHLGIFRVGMCRPGLQIGTPF